MVPARTARHRGNPARLLGLGYLPAAGVRRAADPALAGRVLPGTVPRARLRAAPLVLPRRLRAARPHPLARVRTRTRTAHGPRLAATSPSRRGSSALDVADNRRPRRQASLRFPQRRPARSGLPCRRHPTLHRLYRTADRLSRAVRCSSRCVIFLGGANRTTGFR
jgi:hypothetical protein